MDPAEPLEDVASRVCAPLVARHRDRVDISALLVVSSSTGGKVPGIAQRVAKQAGLPTNVLAFDMNAACSGFVYGLISGLSLCESGGAVIVCAVEAMSRLIDKSDRNTGCLFGDGTGAVLVESRPTFREYRWHAGCDGDRVDLMRGEIGGGIQLDGMQVYDRAVRTMSDTVNRLHDDGIEPTVVIGHQANSRILQKIREAGRHGRRGVRRLRRTIREHLGGLDPTGPGHLCSRAVRSGDREDDAGGVRSRRSMGRRIRRLRPHRRHDASHVVSGDSWISLI